MTQCDITYTDFKREDTTNDITIKLYDDNKRPIIPDASHTWKAKVAKGDKYVGEYPVAIFGNTIKLSSSNLTRLPDGIYALELWETYDGSTAIYPSTGTMEFRVHENIDDTLGTIDPTTDINGIIDDLHKAGQNIKAVATNTLPAGSKASVTQSITNGENQLTFNIPQGEKGEQGDVGPAPTLKIGTITKLNPDQAPTANFSGGNGSYTLNLGIPQGVQGETNPTATQALSVANSVNSKIDGITSNGGGRNLLRNSSGKFQPNLSKVDNWLRYDSSTAYMTQGQQYTVHADTSSGLVWSGIHDNTKENNNVVLWLTDDTKVSQIISDANTGTRTTFTWNNPSGTYYLRVNTYKSDNSGYAEKVMLEKGTVAHDWQLAPEDIQSEIDALKEAVKKLGGDNLAPLVAPVMLAGDTKVESTTHGHAQRFALPLGETELLPKTDILVNVLSGDTIGQSFVIETDATSINGSFTFFMNDTSSHHMVPFNVQQLTTTKYLVSASYTTNANGSWRILDIMRLNLTGGTYVEFSNPYAGIDLSGGVAQTNLLADWATNCALGNWTTNDTTVQTKIANAVLSFNVKSSSTEYVDFYNKDVNLTPGHAYKLSYMARGTGIVRSHLYAWTNKGSTSETDSLNFTTLTDDWRQYSQTIVYDPTSDNSSNTKHFLFRWKESDCESLTGQISDLSLVDITE